MTAKMSVSALRPVAAGALALMLTLLVAPPAHAQLNGENLLGDMGVKSGSQPEPGLYVSSIYYRYFTDTLKNPVGDRIQIDPTGQASQTIQAGMPLLYYVSKKKLFGANLGAMAVVPIAKGALEAPGFGLSEEVSTGLSDVYVMPAQLGATLVDMESYAFAVVCERLGVPMQLFKVPSDFADSSTTQDEWDGVVVSKSRQLFDFVAEHLPELLA